MKKLILICVFLYSFGIVAQNHRYYFSNFGHSLRNNEADYLKEKTKISENNISSSKFFVIDKAGKSRLSTETVYDRYGNFIEKSHYNKKGLRTYHVFVEWTNDGKMKRIDRKDKNDKSNYTATWEFNENGKVSSYVTFRKGKPFYDGIYTYRDSLLVEAQYGKKGSEERDRWLYSYYPDGQKKEIISYNKKGKEKHRWSYTCDTEGKQIKKDETEVCRKSEFDESGRRKEVFLYTDEKQKTRKLVMIYNTEDQLVEIVRYNKKDELIAKELNEYDENGNRTVFKYYQKDRLRSHVVFEYNNSNLLVKETYFKSNKGVKNTYSHEYNMF